MGKARTKVRHDGARVTVQHTKTQTITVDKHGNVSIKPRTR